MKNSVRLNFIYNTVFQIVILIIPLITTPYVSRILGAENIGQLSFATSLVTYFVVFATLGSTIYGQRAIAFYRDNKVTLSEIFWNVFSFRLISSIIAIFLYLIYIYKFEGYTLLKILVTLNIINVIVDISWFFQGIEEFKRIIIRSVFIKAISLILVYILVKGQNDTWIYTLIISGSLVFGNIALWVILPKYVLPPENINPFKDIKGMFLIFLPTIATQVYTILDKSMIGWITSSNYANGCYEQSEKLARAAITIVTSVGAVILPRVANLYKKGNLDEAKRYVYLSYRVVWGLALPLMFGLSSIASFLIPIYLGTGFELSIPLIKIFSLLILFVSLAYVTGISYLIPTNQQNIYTISVTVAAIVNFIMNLILISKIGAIGAALASVTAEFIGVFIQMIFCIKNKQLLLKSIICPSWKYLLASFIMYFSIVIIKQFLSITVINLLLLIIVGGITYITILILLKDDFLINNLKLFFNNIFNRKSDFRNKEN